MNHYTIDVKSQTTPFPHIWEECVGSCHAATALREDWRRQLKKCHEDLGFKSVRFHGLFNDDMSVYSKTENGSSYSFYNIDLIYSYLLELGMKPFVELSFMPSDMASGDQTAFHYKANVTPPSDYTEWAKLIENYARHIVGQFGIEAVRTWKFEVWNEPESPYFWSGGMDEYFKLYACTAQALKKIDPQLCVGGPATGGEKWIDELISYCEKNSVPLDFISTHHYPTDVGIGFGYPMEERMAKSPRGSLKKKILAVREKVGNRPLFYTEWSSSPGNRDCYHDLPYAAAFIIKTLADNQGLADIYSYWAFTDIFEEMQTASTPFHGSFGLQTIHGIPKPAYRAFQILHGTGTERLPVTGGDSQTLEVLAVKKGSGSLTIIAYNHNVPLSPIKEEKAELLVNGISSYKSATVQWVDENHCNPRKEWTLMGNPEYLNKEQLQTLLDASMLKGEPIDSVSAKDGVLFSISVAPHGVCAIKIDI